MRVTSFLRTGSSSWASPRLQMPSCRGRGKKSAPVFFLVAKGPVVTGSFVWGVGGYPGRGFPGRELTQEAILISGD